MKLVSLLGVLLASFLLFPAGLPAAKIDTTKTSTWQGTLVDSDCYLKNHANVGNDHEGVKGCGTACLKKGLPAGLLTKGNAFHTMIAPSLALAPYVGDQVRVTGSMHSDAILAQKVEVRKNGKWEEVNLKTMM